MKEWCRAREEASGSGDRDGCKWQSIRQLAAVGVGILHGIAGPGGKETWCDGGGMEEGGGAKGLLRMSGEARACGASGWC